MHHLHALSDAVEEPVHKRGFSFLLFSCMAHWMSRLKMQRLQALVIENWRVIVGRIPRTRTTDPKHPSFPDCTSYYTSMLPIPSKTSKSVYNTTCFVYSSKVPDLFILEWRTPSDTGYKVAIEGHKITIKDLIPSSPGARSSRRTSRIRVLETEQD